MSIFALEINYKTAPVAVREKVFFALDKLSFYLQDLINRESIEEAVLLSTCNRSALYAVTSNLSLIEDWFYAQTSLPRRELEPFLHVYQDEQAVAHIMRVACGLDSMILGEPQILGQMKEAFSESVAAGAVGPLFQRLFQQVFSTAKEIRTTTAIGACPVSVASAAAHFAKLQMQDVNQDFKKANIALIGAGDMTGLLLRYFDNLVSNPVILVNRSVEKAIQMTETFRGKACGFDKLIDVLTHADIVFSATGSALPIISQEMMEQVMVLRQQKPIVMIDIAVPRDIQEDVALVQGVGLFCIDDLKMIIEKNRQGREHAADKAQEMIVQKSRAFIHDLASADKVTHTIRAYRRQIEDICRLELQRAKHQLHQGMDPAEVLDAFAYAFTKKLLHAPSVQLRQAGAEGRFEILSFAKQLFAIPDPEIETL